MKVILTGAAGFIGSCFLEKLNSMGIDHVITVDTAPDGHHAPNLSKKKFVDYMTREGLLECIEKSQLKEFNAIVHLGACSDTTEKNEQYLIENNFKYSQKLATWALANNKLFHYASSAAVYGVGENGYSDNPENFGNLKPLNYYGQSKLMFDQWIAEEDLLNKVVGYRYFNVFGPNEYHKENMRSMVCKSYEQIQKDGKARLFATTRDGYADGSEQRDFVYIKDVNDVMAYFLENPERNGIFNVGTGKARSFQDLVAAVFSALGRPAEIEYIPMPENLKDQYQYYTRADISRLRRAGYQKPFLALEDSVKDYVAAHLSQKNPHI